MSYDMKEALGGLLIALLITLAVAGGLAIPLGFTASDPLRLVILLLLPAGLAFCYQYRLWRYDTERLNLYCKILAIPVAILVGQWLFYGCAHTFETHYVKDLGTVDLFRSHYYLDPGEIARLPLFGSYARYDGNSITVRRSFWSEEVKIPIDLFPIGSRTPKAVGLSLFGDRVALRFHSSTPSGDHKEGERMYFDCSTGKYVFSHTPESGYWHGGLRLIW